MHSVQIKGDVYFSLVVILYITGTMHDALNNGGVLISGV